MIKGTIHEEDIVIANTYVPIIEAPQYIRQALTYIKGEIDSNTIIIVVFNGSSRNNTSGEKSFKTSLIGSALRDSAV